MRAPRLPLFWRLYLPIALAVFIAGAVVRHGLLIHDLRSEQAEAARRTLQLVAEVLTPAIVEAEVTGDYARLAASMAQQMRLRPELERIAWRHGQTQLTEARPPQASAAPAWFAARIGLPRFSRSERIRYAGADYGELALTIDPAPAWSALWQQAKTQVGVVLGVLALLLPILAWSLRSSLTALRQLLHTTERFRQDHGVRARPGGAREIHALALAFNHMADEIQTVQARWQEEAELNQVTLMSIGDAVLVTDAQGRVMQMNPEAERLTGWSEEEARGRPLAEVFVIINEVSRAPAASPVERVLAEGMVVGLANHTALIDRAGKAHPIEDSAAPIRAADGRILGAVLVFRDVSDKHLMQERLAWQATHDPLTALPNRALLADRLAQAIARADRDQRLMAVALVDLDHFKPVNDRLGHAAGDALLIEAALHMRAALRPTDTLARLGGDEFVVVLTDLTTVPEAETILQRLLERLAVGAQIEGETLTLTASVGYTVYPLDHADADTLLRHADMAMYAAKHAGRQRCHLFDAAHDQAEQTRRQRQERVRQALATDEFVLYYQPKVDLRRGVVLGFEALARWRHPIDGVLGPAAFLPDMEGHELACALGRFALDAASERLAAWSRVGRAWTVAVNIAPAHFIAPDFIADLTAALARHPDAPPDRLQLEIVESAALADIDRAIATIEACHALGVTVAVDDFGVGYASLAYLKRLPADTLKIDQSFVRDILDDANDLALVEGIVTLAALFGRDVVAEGVELAEQGVLLMRLGCDVAQGYGISPPLPAEAIEDWVASFRPDPAWALWADTRWELADFPLLVAQYDHLRWVKSVLRVLDGQRLALSEAELDDHHHCRLGHWYDTHGRQRYGHLASFLAMEPIHAAVHETGREIVRLARMGDLAAAQAQAQRLLALKDQVLDHLARLQREILQQDKEPGAG
ncbi:MAG: EAL domain-containing protein [Thiobacillaceae bacterium]